MATVRGILGQAAPAATTLTDLYTVPAGKNATGRVIITNRSGNQRTFRVALAKDGDADVPQHYVAWDRGIAGDDTGSTIAFMLGSGDVLRVFSSHADLSFTFTGVENDNAT